jgi:hypothetical protein
MSKTSPLFVSNELYTHICSDCANDLYNDAKIKYKDEKIALIVLCHYLDVYFSEELYEKVKSNANFSYGNYSKLLNGTQYKAKNFTTFLINILNDGLKDESQLRAGFEAKWSTDDIKSKNRILNIMKYDPFEGASDLDRKFMFNLCNDYLQDESTIEDPHKLQGVIELIKTHAQLKHVNAQLDAECLLANPNEAKLKTLSGIKKDLMALINSFAKENGISASLSSKGQKGSSSFAYHVKNLDEIRFTDSQINLFDLKTCQSMKQFNDMSNASILSQLHLNADELGEMAEQRTQKIYELTELADKLKEENRLLKIKIEALSNELNIDEEE